MSLASLQIRQLLPFTGVFVVSAATTNYGNIVANDSRKARQVRWVARNLDARDRVTIRPKESQPEAVRHLFNPGQMGKFEVSSEENSIVSGPPVESVLSDQSPTFIRWEYDVFVKRNGVEIGHKDPVIMIHKED